MKRIEVTKFEYLKCEILGVLDSTLSLIPRNKTTHSWVNTKIYIKTRLGLKTIKGLVKKINTRHALKFRFG